MNSCQKHQKHHHHEHHCRKPQPKLSPPKQCVSRKSSRARESKVSYECGYLSRKDESAERVQRKFETSLVSKEEQNTQIRTVLNHLQHQNDELTAENKHLYAQIEYYREQFTEVIAAHHQETKQEWRQRVKEHTELVLKIKRLESIIADLTKNNESLQDELSRAREGNEHNRLKYTQLENKNHTSHVQRRKLEREREQFRDEARAKGRQLAQLTEQYEILKKEFSRQCGRYQNDKKRMKEEIEDTLKEARQTKGKASKQGELMQLQIQSLRQKEEALKVILDEHEQKLAECNGIIKDLSYKNRELEEDLMHAKAVIEKNQALRESQATLGMQLQEKQTVEVVRPQPVSQATKQVTFGEKKTQTVVQRSNFNSGSKSNEKRQVEVDKENGRSYEMKEEIERLRKKVFELQSQSKTTIEEVIMNMGASEAFKKLVEEKNATIKKLIRQKGEIYQRVAAGMS